MNNPTPPSDGAELAKIALIAFPNDREARNQYMVRIQAYAAQREAKATEGVEQWIRNVLTNSDENVRRLLVNKADYLAQLANQQPEHKEE